MSKILLNGFGFSGYRSVGDELVKIAPLKKVNLIIGQNNSGKSNVVNFLAGHYAHFSDKVRIGQHHTKQTKFNSFDHHLFQKTPLHRISFPIAVADIDNYLIKKIPDGRYAHELRKHAKTILCSKFFLSNQHIWFTFKSPNPNSEFTIDIDENEISNLLHSGQWEDLWHALTGSSGGNLRAHWVPQTIKCLTYIPVSNPNIEVIPAIRKIGMAGSTPTDYSGTGLIERLAKIQNPPFTEQILKSKFDKINTFARDVLENNSATIEIPYSRDMILVHMDAKTLPLESLGTGVHEVIIIAAAATLLEDTIVCIEEPELHLHPLLQKKLVRYLDEKTDNQYFFTTHSAHLLDAVEAEIFHVTNSNGASKVDAISSTKQKSNICNDLGYKASDILQTNCIIWVEGPSDRIYLNYWLAHKNSQLMEGTHYSIMFYGGKLFSHLTALDDDETTEILEDFISLKNLNRNVAIVFDSDKRGARHPISATKKRLKEEFEKNDGFCWITDGREIENYLDVEKLEASILKVHASAGGIANKDKWSNLLDYSKKNSPKKLITASKVKVAREYVSSNLPDLKIFDLEKKVSQLTAFIAAANGKT